MYIVIFIQMSFLHLLITAEWLYHHLCFLRWRIIHQTRQLQQYCVRCLSLVESFILWANVCLPSISPIESSISIEFVFFSCLHSIVLVFLIRVPVGNGKHTNLVQHKGILMYYDELTERNKRKRDKVSCTDMH